MNAPKGRGRIRLVEVVRLAWGCVLLLAPRRLMGALPVTRVDRRSLAVARVLGARHVAQALASGLSPSPEVLAAGAWVDGAHAVTAVALAIADPGRRGAGLTDAGVAATFSCASTYDISRGRVETPGHDRWRDRAARAVVGALPLGPRLLRRAADARRASSDLGAWRLERGRRADL